MKIEDEIYYETHEDTLLQEYYDFLTEMNFNKNEFTLTDYIETYL